MFALTLPLIIAHGKFTMLDDMKDDEMETFVSFLVKCDKNCNSHVEEPPWWLPNLPFVHPIKRPNKVTRKWRHKLKSLIKKCYKYYDCEILIDLSGKLAREQQQNNIKFIVKCSHLTSVYNNAKSMIIVTIRNENLTYDLENLDDKLYQTRKLNRMCYSCNRMADLVIEDSPKRIKLEPEDVTPLPTAKESFTQNEFLNMFELSSKENNSSVFVVNPPPSNHGRINFTKAPHIPFSSQLGRRLATKIKYFVQDATHMKRLERIARYLNTSPIPALHPETNFTPPVTHSKHSSRWYHKYKFPGKTYKSHLRNYSDRTNFLASKCLPCSVDIVPYDFTKQDSKDITECIDLTDDESDEVIVIEETIEDSPMPSEVNYNQIIETIIIDDNDSSDLMFKEVGKKTSACRTNSKFAKAIPRRSNRLGTIIISDENDNSNLLTNVNATKANSDKKGETLSCKSIINQKVLPEFQKNPSKKDDKSSKIILKQKSLPANVDEGKTHLDEKYNKPSDENISKRKSLRANLKEIQNDFDKPTNRIVTKRKSLPANVNETQKGLDKPVDKIDNENVIQTEVRKRRPRRKCAKKSFGPPKRLRSRKKLKNKIHT